MRLRYTLTSDLQDVPSHIKQQLESYAKRIKLDSKIYKIINELGEKKINFAGLEQEVLWLREELVILDQLLIESTELIKACEKAEKGEIENQPISKELETTASQSLQQDVETAAHPQKNESVANIQNSFAQLNNMAKTFKEMKESNKEKYKA